MSSIKFEIDIDASNLMILKIYDAELFLTLLIIKAIDYLSNPKNKIYYSCEYVYKLLEYIDNNKVDYLNYTYTAKISKELLAKNIYREYYITSEDFINKLKMELPMYLNFSYINLSIHNILESIFNVTIFNSTIYINSNKYSPIMPVLLETLVAYEKNAQHYKIKQATIGKLLLRKLKKLFVNILKIPSNNFKETLAKTTIYSLLESQKNLKIYKSFQTFFKYNKEKIYTFLITDFKKYKNCCNSLFICFIILEFFVQNNLNKNIEIYKFFEENSYIASCLLSDKHKIANKTHIMEMPDFISVSHIPRNILTNVKTFYDKLFFEEWIYDLVQRKTYTISPYTIADMNVLNTLSFLYTVQNNDTIDVIINLQKRFNQQEFISVVFKFLDKYLKEDETYLEYRNELKDKLFSIIALNIDNFDVISEIIPSYIFKELKDDFIQLLQQTDNPNRMIMLYSELRKHVPEIIHDDSLREYETLIF